MMHRMILRFFFLLSVILPAGMLAAQDQHFIYLQSENSQPFYVKLKDKLYSSTAAGYVILPKLASGDYELHIGFPRNQFPEEEFNVAINGQNEGFLLKNLNNNWSLLNLESMALISGVASVQTPGPETAPQPAQTIVSDPFSSLLADVIKDSSILKVNNPAEVANTPASAPNTAASDLKDSAAIAQVATPEPVNEKTEAPNEVVPAPKPAAQAEDVAKNTAEPAPEGKRAEVENPFVRILLVNEAGGQDMVYVNSVTADTIRLFMPARMPAAKAEKKPRAKIVYQPEDKDTSDLTITPTVVTPPAEKPAEEKTAQIIYHPEPQEPAAEQEKKADAMDQLTNPDCKSTASEKEFLKLRKRMAGEKDFMKMVDVARRFFRSNCFTTEQIRNLSYLFLDDEGRYQFFDAAYPYTADPAAFGELESQLTDPYYINRFKAMIHK